MPDWLDQDIWTDLRGAFERGQLVIFAGAGVSAAGGLPLWPALAADLVERVRRSGKVDAAEEAEQSLKRGRLVEALSAAQHALGAVTFGDAVAKSVDDRGKTVPEVARAIAGLRDKLQGVVTTNLDRFLERAGEGEWLETIRPVGDLAQQRGFLWKAHGTVQDRATWVFARAAYDRVMFGDPQYKATFGALYKARTFLFVGCGLSDDDLDLHLGEARALSGEQPPMHFALLEGPILSYRRKTLEDAGIRILAYPRGQHDQVTSVLRMLGGAPVTAQASSVTQGPSPAQARTTAQAPSPAQAPSAHSPSTVQGPTGVPSPPPMAANAGPLLEDEVLREVHGAILSAGLSRTALLATVDRGLVAGLHNASSVAAQIWGDLAALNALGALLDGSIPLRTVLVTAAHLASPRRETATFEKAIRSLAARTAAPAPTPKRGHP